MENISYERRVYESVSRKSTENRIRATNWLNE